MGVSRSETNRHLHRRCRLLISRITVLTEVSFATTHYPMIERETIMTNMIKALDDPDYIWEIREERPLKDLIEEFKKERKHE